MASTSTELVFNHWGPSLEGMEVRYPPTPSPASEDALDLPEKPNHLCSQVNSQLCQSWAGIPSLALLETVIASVHSGCRWRNDYSGSLDQQEVGERGCHNIWAGSDTMAPVWMAATCEDNIMNKTAQKRGWEDDSVSKVLTC